MYLLIFLIQDTECLLFFKANRFLSSLTTFSLRRIALEISDLWKEINRQKEFNRHKVILELQ